MGQEFAHKVIRNTVFIVYGRIWFLVLSIVLTPYILSRLGDEEYGIWVLVGSFVMYVGLFDCGFATSFVKHVAEYDARGDREGVNGVLSAGLVFYLVFAVIVLVAASSLIDTLVGLLKIPPGLEDTTRVVLQVAIIASLFANCMGVYHSIINGLQRMDISSGIMVFLSVWYGVGCVVALSLGFGLKGLAVNQLVAQVIGIVASVFFAYRLYPGLKFRLEGVRHYGATLFRYGLNLHLSNMAAVANAHLDKLLVNWYTNPAHVALYDIGSRPPTLARSFPVLALSSLTPATSELGVRQGREQLYELFGRVSKYVSVVAFPLFLLMMLASHRIIEAWVGPGYDGAAVVMQILSVGYLISVLAGPVSPLVQGMGYPEYQRNAEGLSLVLNIVLSVALIARFGFYGAPIGTAIAMSISSVYYLWSFHRFIRRPLLPFLKSTCMKPALCAAASGVLGSALASMLLPYASGDRWISILVLLAIVVVFAGCYLVLITRSGFLEAKEIGLLMRQVSFSRPR